MSLMRSRCFMAKKMFDRKVRSVVVANIILEKGLFDEFAVFRYQHQKIKSMYRLANLFLLHKKLRYVPVDKLNWSVNCSNLLEFYFQ